MTATSAAIEQLQGDLGALAARVEPTEMPDVERVARAKHVFLKRMSVGLAMNLESCVNCGMCAEACHFYLATQEPRYAPVRKFQPLRRFYRRELSPMRWLNRLFVRDISVDDLKDWQELVYDACTACGRCDMLCPMGIGISETVRLMREGLAAAGLIPDELQVVDQEQKVKGTVLDVGPDQFRAVVQELAAEGIDIPVDKDQADILVLSTALNIRLFKQSIAGTAKIMNKLGVDWMMSSRCFEATNFGYLSGDYPAEKTETLRIVDEARACGASKVIVPECGHAYMALRWEGANILGERPPFRTLAISEFIGREIEAGRLRVKTIDSGKSVTFHDSCRLVRHGGLLTEPRTALRALGLDLKEMESRGRTAICCGAGEGVNFISRAEPLRRKAFKIKMKEVDDSGADSLVTSCDNCRYNFLT
ncbi:MAG: 4Fe-4S dicluster domain-containing protein, partial [Desulfobulbaceae bacterium]|nr:4Fe-4S dicluster domain-containing protein [Desulfobulbaceae bacterium]